ncbi:hypothetical protein acsn021_11330 [Anaerocolumna cellulosilytica]|uniref:Uncharacterized protein n=1 Tax=Anaerocolumna cellulosilytica TaxID=433286 RepID=A0A6S6QSH4_9FIRM|nr:C39 family peptidase [Anaerocolumna cellulosilytica]MBB5194619.1 hypothetical protein [Anaerocolumna cellulosilytica]BCJ93564.1 hypothetical protein acsn021_11330 [Anaerocolumna cellulosilytica]
MNTAMVLKIAQAAYKALKDKRTRTIIILAIFGPLILLLLQIAAIVSLVTTPIQMLLNGGEDTYGLAEFQNQFVITGTPGEAYEGEYEPPDYVKYTIKQGATEVVYYNQTDMPWRDMLYGTVRTIGISGCGPTSMAIVISTFTGQEVTPAMTAGWSAKNGYLVEGYNNGKPYGMSSHALIPALAKEYSLSSTGIAKNEKTAERIYKALSDGKLVVAIMGPGHFTSGGHFIVLRGVTSDGKILVADCGSRQRTGKAWDIQTIIKEAKGGAGAGGPFWAIK